MLTTYMQATWWTIERIGAAIVILAVLIGAAIFGTAHVYAQSSEPTAQVEKGMRLITLYDQGVERSFVTKGTTVAAALREANVEISQYDNVEPARDEALVADEYTVTIYRARPIVVIDGASRQRIVTASQVPEQIAMDAGLTLYAEDTTELRQSADFAGDGAALQFIVERATPVNLTLYGDTATIRTHADTVGDMLREKGITLGSNDRTSLPLSTAITPDMELRVWREGKQTITIEENVTFSTEEIKDMNRPPEFKEIRAAGRDGTRQVTYEVIIQDGREVQRTEIASITTKEPVTQVQVVGAKFVYTGGPLTEEQMNFLGTCESGMTPTRNSGNGFYGAFQFMPATWRTVAPAPYNTGMPHEAPLDVQKQAVQNLLSRSSIFTQFPGCAKKMRAAGII